MDQPLSTVLLTTTNNLAGYGTYVPYLIVVCGATATGKSGLATALAQRLHSAILSADSRQVYREFNIGTAKPSIEEQQQVPHYLIDICAPTETLSVAEYQVQAQELIEGGANGQWSEVSRRRGGEVEGTGEAGEAGRAEGKGQEAEGNVVSMSEAGDNDVRSRRSSELIPLSRLTSLKTQNSLACRHTYEVALKEPVLLKTPPTPRSPLSTPLLVGGTGLYIRSIVRGLKIPRVPPQPSLRSQLQALGQSQLYAFLQQIDPVAAMKIHPNDQVRTLRSLEVFYVTGRPMSTQQGEQPPNYPILQIGLDCQSVEQSDRRIEQRTEQMVAAGLLQEVEQLCRKYGSDLPLLNTLGYAEFRQHLAGDISLAEAKALTVMHTRQFAKRQRTWFRADPTIEWFDAESPDLLEQVWQRVQTFLAHH